MKPFICILLASFIIAGCDEVINDLGDENDDKKVKSIEIEASNLQVLEYDSLQLSALVYYYDGTSNSANELTWESQNSSIAKIDSKGIVLGVSKGSVDIKGTLKGVSSSITIQVIENQVESISIENAPDSICISRKFQFKPNILVQSGIIFNNPKLLKWTSSDPSILSVSNEGLLFAKS